MVKKKDFKDEENRRIWGKGRLVDRRTGRQNQKKRSVEGQKGTLKLQLVMKTRDKIRVERVRETD